MYVTPGTSLIPQKNNTSCWYAAAQMLIQWKRNTARMTFRDHPDPSQLAQTVAWEVAANGIINPQVLTLARLLGLHHVPPLSPSLRSLEARLRRHGPLWTNGKGHIVVIDGVDATSGMVHVLDPWPPRHGKIEWRSYSEWYIGNVPVGDDEPDSSRDVGLDVEATFLYHP